MFDYIIVGAGSAGCVLASRLTENSNVSVLLIEAGGRDDLPAIHNPDDYAKLLLTSVDWAYFTEEEPHLNNRKIYWPRGKVLGGSSSTNFMGYVHGNRLDYDHWEALGNKGWSFAEALPYFKKIENFERGALDYHGIGGPLSIAEPPTVSPLTEAFIEAGMELGWPRNTDYNGASQDGFGLLQLTAYQGKRQSTAVGYLHPVENRTNLTIWTDMLVTRVLFEGTQAIGVAYLKDGMEQQVRAQKEIILAGGAINSPQLLLLSGVGPADQLRKLGIPVVTDLPGVGGNLHDHPNISVTFMTKPSFTHFGYGGEATAFVKTQPDLLIPDLQILFAPCFMAPLRGNGYTNLIALSAPRSRGHLTLRSTDPTQYPVIRANYLSESVDLQALVKAVKLARRLGHAKAFAPFYEEEVYPGSRVQSDKEIIEYIRESVQTTFHPVGTCKMGHDTMAVVDDQLRVRSIEGLRIVDASIIPTIISGNTNAAVIMIAEKGADLIAHPRAIS